MSLEFVGSKHSVDDVYPLRNKRVFLPVDSANIIGNVIDYGSTVATIDKLIHKGASVVIASSFGSLTGITLNLSRKEREVAVSAFSREGGLDLTHFLSAVPPSMKLNVLHAVPGLVVSSSSKNVPNTGKTTLFASLSNEQKLIALEKLSSRTRSLCLSQTTATLTCARHAFPARTSPWPWTVCVRRCMSFTAGISVFSKTCASTRMKHPAMSRSASSWRRRWRGNRYLHQ